MLYSRRGGGLNEKDAGVGRGCAIDPRLKKIPCHSGRLRAFHAPSFCPYPCRNNPWQFDRVPALVDNSGERDPHSALLGPVRDLPGHARPRDTPEKSEQRPCGRRERCNRLLWAGRSGVLRAFVRLMHNHHFQRPRLGRLVCALSLFSQDGDPCRKPAAPDRLGVRCRKEDNEILRALQDLTRKRSSVSCVLRRYLAVLVVAPLSATRTRPAGARRPGR